MKTRVMKINGEWDLGYVLDWHTLSSGYAGDNAQGHPKFDTTRYEVGEALYQLKYKLNLHRVAELADTFVANLKGVFKSASLIIPMPPSKKRGNYSAALHLPTIRLSSIPVLELNSLLVNIWSTAEQLRSEVFRTFCT